jgi:hypothetical protein
VHTNITPLPSVGQLENYGLTANQALDVYNAESNGTAVEVSYDGTVVVNANQGGTPSANAVATSGAKTNDVSAAIGDGTSASATGSGAVAFDLGANETSNGDTATANTPTRR